LEAGGDCPVQLIDLSHTVTDGMETGTVALVRLAALEDAGLLR